MRSEIDVAQIGGLQALLRARTGERDRYREALAAIADPAGSHSNRATSIAINALTGTPQGYDIRPRETRDSYHRSADGDGIGAPSWWRLRHRAL